MVNPRPFESRGSGSTCGSSKHDDGDKSAQILPLCSFSLRCNNPKCKHTQITLGLPADAARSPRQIFTLRSRGLSDGIFLVWAPVAVSPPTQRGGAAAALRWDGRSCSLDLPIILRKVLVPSAEVGGWAGVSICIAMILIPR